MKGRRSSDENYAFGYPSEFLGNVLPSEKEIVSHAHFLRRQNTGLGVWKQNTPDKEVAKTVTRDIFGIWGKTEIPCYGTSVVEDRVERVLGRAKNVLKVKSEKRNEAELALARGLKPGSKATVERVLQNNSFFAHHENILIAMLRDESEEVWRRAVLFIRYGND